MDSIIFLLGLISGGCVFMVGLFIGSIYGKKNTDTVPRQEREPITVVLQTPQVPLPQEQEEKESKKRIRPGELGAVKRPSAEDLGKKDKPLQTAEEKEMEDSLDDVFGESIKAMAESNNKGQEGIWMK